MIVDALTKLRGDLHCLYLEHEAGYLDLGEFARMAAGLAGREDVCGADEVEQFLRNAGRRRLAEAVGDLDQWLAEKNRQGFAGSAEVTSGMRRLKGRLRQPARAADTLAEDRTEWDAAPRW